MSIKDPISAGIKDPLSAGQCTALTIKGTQCTRTAKDGFCGMHSKQISKSIILTFEQPNYSIEDLKKYQKEFKDEYTCELIDLNQLLPFYDTRRTEEAALLIVRNFHQHDMNELEKLEWETQTILRKKLVNRRDKYILNDIPLINVDFNKAKGHYYFNASSGEKYHGDLNNRMINFGKTNLYFQWFFNKQKQGDVIKITLGNDLLMMSEKASGFDFKSKLVPVLKHAIGDKFKN